MPQCKPYIALDPRLRGDDGADFWKTSQSPIPYPDALAEMQKRVAGIRAGTDSEQIWLLEHPPCFTAGTSAQGADLVGPSPFPVYETGRGGQYTYHGPGQRIGYAMLDLQKRGIDIRDYVCRLEKWIIAALADFGVKGELRDGRIGVWVRHGAQESKIAAIGVRVSRGVAFHGISINVNPDLSHYRFIIPCGIKEHGVTSLEALGARADMAQLDAALQRHFPQQFGVE